MKPIIITDGPHVADPLDMCPIATGQPSCYFGVSHPWRGWGREFGRKRFWVNLYRFILVKLIRHHVKAWS